MKQSLSSDSREPLRIRDAEEKDICRIVEIHNSLVVGSKCLVPQRGFFLQRISPEKILAQINRPDRVFLVAQKEGQVAAYLIAQKKLEQLDSLQWLDPQAKASLHEEHHWHIDQVATASSFARQGCAHRLYNELVRRSQNGPLSCYVATHPYRNQASLEFHSELGFQVVAQFESPSFLGIADYKSVLLLRQDIEQL